MKCGCLGPKRDAANPWVFEIPEAPLDVEGLDQLGNDQVDRLGVQRALFQIGAVFKLPLRIHRQKTHGRTTRGGQSNKHDAAGGEVLGMAIFTRVEERDDLIRFRIDAGQVRPLWGCNSGNCNATDLNRPRSLAAYPIVSVSALLSLADWYRTFRSTVQGGQPCNDCDRGASDGFVGHSRGIVSVPALEGHGGRGSPPDSDDPQPDRSQELQPPPVAREVPHEDR